MKISDVEVGKRYAAHDYPTARPYRRSSPSDLPREVEVLEVVTREECVRGTGWDSRKRTRNVRRLKVRAVGPPRMPGRSYTRAVLAAQEGETLVIEARLLLAPWEALVEGIAEKVEMENQRTAHRDALEARLDALGMKGRSRVTVEVYGGELTANLYVQGEDVEAFLALAEKGAAA